MGMTWQEQSVDRALAQLAIQHNLEVGDAILQGTRFSIAHGGQVPSGVTYLIMDGGRIVQRCTLEFSDTLNRRTVGAYNGSRRLRHRIVTSRSGLRAEVEDGVTGAYEQLSVCVGATDPSMADWTVN